MVRRLRESNGFDSDRGGQVLVDALRLHGQRETEEACRLALTASRSDAMSRT
jgi:hypothetical protein